LLEFTLNSHLTFYTYQTTTLREARVRDDIATLRAKTQVREKHKTTLRAKTQVTERLMPNMLDA
jgi:hypothetical protein